MPDQFLQQLAAVSEPQLAYLVPISDDPSGTGDLKKIALSALLTLYAAAGHDHDGTYAALAHDHDDRYYLEGEVDSLISAAVSFSVARGNHTGSQAISTVTGLQTALDGKSAVGHGHVIGDTTGLQTALDAKADLVGGVVPTSQLPALAISEFLGTVADQTELLALTGQLGDFAIREDTSTVWIIVGPDPSDIGDWQELEYPPAPVSSVNSQTGEVVLSYSDVGAAAASHAHAIGDVTGLQTALDGKSAVGHTHAVSEDAGNEASLGTDDLLYVGPMRMRSITVYTASQNIAIPTGDWQWMHIRLVGPGGGGGSSSTNSRGGQAGGAGGGVDGWISRATWDAQMASWIASLAPSVPDAVVIVLTVGAAGTGGTPGNSGSDGTLDTTFALRASEEGTPIGTLTLATGALGKGGRVANQSISGWGTGGLGSFDSNWITGIAQKGDGGDGRGTVNAETGFAGGRSMLGGGGDAGPADGAGGNASGYGGGGGSGGRSSSGSNGDGGNGSSGVIILEVYD